MGATKNGFRYVSIVPGFTGLLWMTAASQGGQLYFNGFEPGQPGTADFYDSTSNLPAVPPEITVLPTGTNGIPAASPGSNFYGQIKNVDDSYSIAFGYPLGYGESVLTDYGATRNGNPTGPGVATSGAFYESTAYYISTAWSTSVAPNPNEGFWIDTTPYNDPNFGDETNFRVSDGGSGSINVQLVGYGTAAAGGSFPSLNITKSGWYTFKTTFEDAGGYVGNTLSVLDANGNVIGSAFNDPANYGATPPAPPLQFSDLQGTNYGDWTTVWSNGFANDTLAIDDVTVGTVPEPGTLSLIGIGCAAFLRRRRKA